VDCEFDNVMARYITDDGVIVGVNVLVGVNVGVTVGVAVLVGTKVQSNTVFILPDESKLIAYLLAPSITALYPPGSDVYVLVVKEESLYIIVPFVIGVDTPTYFVNPDV
jgi:hypothetical protein